jgi:ligand-binding sensor domain-containing protein/DNA-binding CsgD family transcriptional regulator
MNKLLLCILLPIAGWCQNTIGLPDITNYSKIDYNAGLQNWDFKQDKNGIMYVANNEGLLSYDGKYWKLYPLPNKTIVRSIEIGADNKIYAGGQDEFGFFTPSNNGQLTYHSLIKYVKDADKDFADVWDIANYKNDVFFRTSRRIFKLSNDKITVYNAPSEWSFVGICNGNLFAHDIQHGLMEYVGASWQPVQGAAALMNVEITAILPLKGSMIITTLKNGVFNYTNGQINKIETATTRNIEKQRIYSATVIDNTWIGLATTNAGVFIIDAKGELIQSLSKTEGIQNNNILNIFSDKQGNLWLGLNNGIDCIGFNNAIKHINPLYQDASAYATIIHQNKLYVGTSSGLFSVPLSQTADLSFNRGAFTPVANTTGQVWNLTAIHNQLLLAHHEGAFMIKDNKATLISNLTGFWNFQPLTNAGTDEKVIQGTEKIVAGNYKGLAFLNQTETGLSFSNIVPDFTQSSRFVAVDDDSHIWVSHPFHGVYKVPKESTSNNGISNSEKPKLYTQLNGLPSSLNNHVYKIKEEILVATEKGVYSYNEQKDKFEPSVVYQKLLGNQSLRYLKEDKEGNLWFIHEKQLGVLDMSTKTPRIIYIPELNNKLLSGFELIYPVDENNIFVGGESGLFNVNFKKYKKNNYELQVHIREVRITGGTDSLLFGGYFNNINEKQQQDNHKKPEISSSAQIIHFEFSSTLFGLQKNLEYSYRLVGLETDWSKWSNKTEKEYTNLPAGNYVFEIKVRDNLGEESEVDRYAFNVLPPWYRSAWAYGMYFVCFILFNLLIIKWQRTKFIEQEKKHEEEQEKLNYLKQLEINKAQNMLTEIQNEKLQLEIDSKNSELINFTMHLVQKGELLTDLKSHMSKMTKLIDNSIAHEELKKMIKVINDAEKMDKDWENFTNHFDKAHNSFTVNIKEKFPKLTANELKLCTFLRVNLSTKEIAQLMNISMRGVEISRYRLRKKLNLPTETSLFDFLNEI